MAGSTTTEPVSARPATTWRGLIGVILSCRSQPSDLSSATPVPVVRAEPSAPYAAMPTIEAVFHVGGVVADVGEEQIHQHRHPDAEDHESGVAQRAADFQLDVGESSHGLQFAAWRSG